MLIVCETPNGWTVETMGTDGKLYSFHGRRPMPRNAAHLAVENEQRRCPEEPVRFCRTVEDREEAIKEGRELLNLEA